MPSGTGNDAGVSMAGVEEEDTTGENKRSRVGEASSGSGDPVMAQLLAGLKKLDKLDSIDNSVRQFSAQLSSFQIKLESHDQDPAALRLEIKRVGDIALGAKNAAEAASRAPSEASLGSTRAPSFGSAGLVREVDHRANPYQQRAMLPRGEQNLGYKS